MTPLRLTRALVVAGLAALGAAPAVAQNAPPPSFRYDLATDTGWVRNPRAHEDVIASFPVVATGVPWMRLHFADVQLAEGARLRVVGHAEGTVQELDAAEAARWARTSAYFNGDALQVEIVAPPRSGRCRVRLRGVTAGAIHPPLATQCGPTDDRTLSSDPRIARLLPALCTGWLLDDCNHCLLTAGHCFDTPGEIDTVQFNVPLSTSNGTLVHPPPEDQYPVDPASRQFANTGLGNDWAYFGAFPNPITGKTAGEAQGVWFTLAPGAPAFDPNLTIRITGYGVDGSPAQHNGVQQTHVGPLLSTGPDVLSYGADTFSGNSGSPVVVEQTGMAVGIHTHGGCTVGGGANSGLDVAQAGLQAALAAPRGVCATGISCGTPEVYCSGKLNSLFCLPFLSHAGAPSASSTAPFTIDAEDLVANRPSLLVYGLNGRGSLPFHGATLCVKAPLTRLLPLQDTGKAGSGLCRGTYSVDFNGHVQSGADPRLSSGTIVRAQVFYQDPGDPFGDGLTDAIEFQIAP